MNQHRKKLYTGIIILAIFLFSAFFAFNLNTITTPNPLLVKEGVQTTTPKPYAVNPPLLDQGGESLPLQARGGNSLEPQPTLETPKTQENTHSVTILAGDMTANLQVAPNTVFYDALIQAKDTGTLNFSGKNYMGLGFFVNEIGTLRAGSGKYLLYYVNGQQATVGVSSYTLRDGDIIEWKLE